MRESKSVGETWLLWNYLVSQGNGMCTLLVKQSYKAEVWLRALYERE